jgi:asparagine N-glycosylation enzyme membrane subunit Stt3
MARKVDVVALVITVLAAALTALFLQGFWSIVISPSSCGNLAWLSVLGVVFAVAIFYAREQESTFYWAIAMLLLVIYVIVILYMTAGGAAAIFPAC